MPCTINPAAECPLSLALHFDMHQNEQKEHPVTQHWAVVALGSVCSSAIDTVQLYHCLVFPKTNS